MRQLFDPTTGRLRKTITESTSHEIATAIERAKSVAPTWAALTPSARSARMWSFVSALQDNSQELARMESESTGKPLSQATAEVNGAIDVIAFYAGAARTVVTPASGTYVNGYFSSVTMEPLGTIGVILPWNYPIMMLAWRLGPILASGNTAVVKPAPETPDSALAVGKIANFFLGPSIVEVVTGPDIAGRLIAVTRALDGLAFTGSVEAGYSVSAAAGIRPVSLELGGNGAALVLPDAPVDTAKILVDASTYNAGQSCAAPTRVIVVGKQTDFIEQLARETRSRNAKDFGPLISERALSRVKEIVAATTYSLGAHGSSPANGYYYPSTLLIDAVGPAVDKEVFGPVLTVERVDTVEEGIAKANSVPQALGCSIHTTSHSSALSIAPRINGGEVWVNCHLVQSPELPHSGRGTSGHGIDLSADAMRDYSRPKTITTRTSNG